jgi:hypothetical protein
MLVLDDNTALSWRRFVVFFFGTLIVAVLAGTLAPRLIGEAWGVRCGQLVSLLGAAALFHLSARRD